MDLDEFLAEQKDKPKPKPIPLFDLSGFDIEADENEGLLPINVYRAVIDGELVYMKITEDGRRVRLDE